MKKTEELAHVPKPIVKKAPALRFKYRLFATGTRQPTGRGQYLLSTWAAQHDIPLDGLRLWATQRGLGGAITVDPSAEELEEWAKQSNAQTGKLRENYWRSLANYVERINQARLTVNPRLRWFILYFALGLECDMPIQEALFTALSHLPVWWDWEQWLQ